MIDTVESRVIALETAVTALARREFGEGPGHPFRGNQWTTGVSGEDKLNYTPNGVLDLREDQKGSQYRLARKLAESVEVTTHQHLKTGAASHRMSMAKYRDAVERKVKGDLKDAPVVVRISLGDFNKVLEDGRFKTQYETRTSGGTLSSSLPHRRNMEYATLGVPRETPDDQRPIYGAIDVGGHGFSIDDHGTYYGEIQVVLKDSVRDHTTFSIGDSLAESQSLHVSSVNDPKAESLFLYGLDPLRTDYSSEDFTRGAYVEAQIHGGVSVSDIEEVIYPSSYGSNYRDLIEKLDDADIPSRALE